MKFKITGIEHIYILCDKTYEPERYYYLLNWLKRYFDSSYFTFLLYCYKHTIQQSDVERYGIVQERLKPSEVSLIINNNKIFEDILDKYDTGNFLILESDVIPETNWLETLTDQMDKLKDKPFDFLHIGNGGNESFLPTIFKYELSATPDVYQCPSARCTEAIVWSYNGIEKYICTRNKPINVPFDFYLNIVASEDVSQLSDAKSYWGHPVVFKQGKHYPSTINDDITIPKRLTGYEFINVVIEPDLMWTKPFIRQIIHFSFPQYAIFHIPTKYSHITVSKFPQKDKRCIVVSDNEYLNGDKGNILLQISSDFTNTNHFVPKIFFSKYMTQLDRLVIPFRHFSMSSYSAVFNYNGHTSTVMTRLREKYKDSSENSIFTFCYESNYAPLDISDQILKSYLANSIPIYRGCNVIVQQLFNEKTYINADDFPNEFFLQAHLENILSDPNLLQSYFSEPIFKDNKIPVFFNEIIKYFSNTLAVNLKNLY